MAAVRGCSQTGVHCFLCSSIFFVNGFANPFYKKMAATQYHKMWWRSNLKQVVKGTQQSKIKGAVSASEILLMNILPERKYQIAVLFDDLVTVWFCTQGDVASAIRHARLDVGKSDVAWAMVFRDVDRIGVCFEDRTLRPKRVSWAMNWDKLCGLRVEVPPPLELYGATRASPNVLVHGVSPSMSVKNAPKRRKPSIVF
jgi:hypothetical protein